MELKAMVYGNALSAFLEKEAQEHIAKKWSLWVNRLINMLGTTRVGTWHLVSEVWKHCAPTPERIDEEISCWPAVNKKSSL
jgi:hypothetical protein